MVVSHDGRDMIARWWACNGAVEGTRQSDDRDIAVWWSKYQSLST
jgi:hypothetical protein